MTHESQKPRACRPHPARVLAKVGMARKRLRKWLVPSSVCIQYQKASERDQKKKKERGESECRGIRAWVVRGDAIPCSREGRHSEGRCSCALHTRAYVSGNGLSAQRRANELQEGEARKNIRRWKIPRCHGAGMLDRARQCVRRSLRSFRDPCRT